MIENSTPLRIFVVAVVGTWIVKHRNAPFPFHMHVFNADHTMQQANPDAGNEQTSDSDGKGVWAVKGNYTAGKWVDIIASRSTHEYTGSGEFTYDLEVDRNKLTGSGSFLSFDADCKSVGRPLPSPFTGTRVTVPVPGLWAAAAAEEAETPRSALLPRLQNISVLNPY